MYQAVSVLQKKSLLSLIFPRDFANLIKENIDNES